MNLFCGRKNGWGTFLNLRFTFFHSQTLYGDTYHFTSECVDLTIPEVAGNLTTNDKYCMENTCWNTSKYPFCVCGAEQFNCTLTGCDNETNKFTAHYLPEDYSVYNGSFSQILIGTVRLMVQLSTENYPDLIRKF